MRVTKAIVQTERTGKSCSGFASTFMSGSMSQLVSKLPMRSFVEPMAPWWPPRPRDMVAGSVDAGPEKSCDCFCVRGALVALLRYLVEKGTRRMCMIDERIGLS